MSRPGRPKWEDLDFLNRTAHLWDEESTEVGFLARVFTQTALPYRNPGDDLSQWVRRNGNLTLTVQPGPPTYDLRSGQEAPTGYPYGSIPRLLLVWMSTEAVRTGERVLPLGGSLSDFMRQIGLSVNGGSTGNIRKLREQARRLLRARIVADFFDLRETASGPCEREASRQLTIADSYDLWWSSKAPNQATLLPSYVELSEKFFREVMTRPVPLSLDALRELRGSPMRLDIYAWLTHRMSYLKKSTTVPWESLVLQFGSNASTERGRRKFRQDFLVHLAQVLTMYPEARVTPTDSGLLLNPSRTHVVKRLSGGS